MELIDITFTGRKYGKIIETADVKTSVGLMVRGVKVIQGNKGIFVAMPSQKNQSTGQFEDVVSFTDPSLEETFKKRVLDAYTNMGGRTEVEPPTPTLQTDEWSDWQGTK